MNFSTDQPPFRFEPGRRPLLVSIPHAGTWLPPALAARLTAPALAVPDTDWHLDRLYDGVRALGASLLVATHSRYVIDLNRPPDDHSLYPGQDVPGLCPIDTFAREPLYADPAWQPDAAEREARRAAIWRPYHRQLQAELARLRERHGEVALWDAHSIRSEVPRFFEGRLADLNLGTADGASCEAGLARRVLGIAGDDGRYSAVLDGRFKGGYITRAYGRPDAGVQALQLEMTWRCYMDEDPPHAYRPERAAQVQPRLLAMLEAVLARIERPPR